MAKLFTHCLLAAALCNTFLASPSASQAPPGMVIGSEFLDQTLRLRNNTLRFCINPVSVLAPLDRAVAQAIADALLLNAEFYEFGAPFEAEPYDYRFQLGARQLFIAMHNNCEASMGLRLAPRQLPDWLSISQPYFSARIVMASNLAGINGFDDIPPGIAIGSRLRAPGDVNLISFLQSLPAADRPRRFPYPDYSILIDRMLEGTVSAILIWEPALHFASDGDPAALGIAAVFDPPHAVPALDFGVAVMAQDTFIRGLIDQAISALTEDGTLEALAREHAMLPGD